MRGSPTPVCKGQGCLSSQGCKSWTSGLTKGVQDETPIFLAVNFSLKGCSQKDLTKRAAISVLKWYLLGVK